MRDISTPQKRELRKPMTREQGEVVLTVEEAVAIWKKTKSPYLKRDMEKFIHKHKKQKKGEDQWLKNSPRK